MQLPKESKDLFMFEPYFKIVELLFEIVDKLPDTLKIFELFD